MLIKLEPQDGYFNFTHDLLALDELNDDFDDQNYEDYMDLPEWRGGPDDPKKQRCRINGSALLTHRELGKVIRALVYYSRKFGGEGYEYVDLSRRRSR